MPAQKRSSNLEQNDEKEPRQHRLRRKQSRRGGAVDQQPTTSSAAVHQQEQHSIDEQQQQQQQDHPAVCNQGPVEKSAQYDSDGSGTDPEDFDEIITVLRSELRSNVQCPICLGIIKQTRTVMGCLHRFCRECIDKSMRLGNNECPTCRIHCKSRRSLRDDQDYDSLIDAIYPDAEKYEEEELVFREEDKTRNEQIQTSIAQISRRQLEALNKRRKLGKDVDDCSLLPLPRSYRNLYSRRRNNKKLDVEGCDANEKGDDDDDENENPSPDEKHGTQSKRRRYKRRARNQPSTSSRSTANTGGGSFGNQVAQISEEMSTPLGAVRSPETLTWGRGGARSHTRHGGAGSSRVTRGSPLSKLVDRFEGVTITETESDVHSTPTSLENGRNPGSEKPLCSSHSGWFSTNQVLEPMWHEVKLPTEGVEMPSANSSRTSTLSAVNSETSMDVPNSSSPNVTQPEVGLQILDGKENLTAISCPSHNEHLVGDIHA